MCTGKKAVSDHTLDKQSRRKTLLFLLRKCFLENIYKKYQQKKKNQLQMWVKEWKLQFVIPGWSLST